MEKQNLKYFLGANTANGFASFYDNLIDRERCRRFYIIKGGPGTGKSTLMRKVASKATENELDVQIIHCSGDPDSLDGVVIPKLNVAIADGTAPHVIDPKFPGAVDSTVDLSECWNDSVLTENRKRVIDVTLAYKSLYATAYRYTAALGRVRADMYSAVYDGVDLEKVRRYCTAFIKKHGIKPCGEKKTPTKRFIGSITHKGVVGFKADLAANCKTTVILQDYCTTASIVTDMLADMLVSTGAKISLYYFENSIAAIHAPEYGLCLIVSDDWLPFESGNTRKIRMVRFIEDCVMHDNKTRIKADKKLCRDLLECAVSALSDAKRLHDALEEIYVSAMDFRKVEAKTQEVVSEIFGL